MDLVTNNFVAHRAFHLILERFNKYVGSELVLILITCGASQIVSAALLIQQTKSDLKMSLPLNLFFLVVVFQTVFDIMAIYGFPGELNQESKISLDFLKRKVMHEIEPKHKRKYYITFLNSCQVSKIRLGLTNYIDKTTPPVSQLFCVDRIIDVLLTQK